jgi:hypothetical protein
MKRIIEGKMYNTETAEEIADWDNGLNRSDFGRTQETLYRTKKGAWFLCGRGGALSRWSQPSGNGRANGAGIETLSEDRALEWCETHKIDADVIAEYFTVEEA